MSRRSVPIPAVQQYSSIAVLVIQPVHRYIIAYPDCGAFFVAVPPAGGVVVYVAPLLSGLGLKPEALSSLPLGFRKRHNHCQVAGEETRGTAVETYESGAMVYLLPFMPRFKESYSSRLLYILVCRWWAFVVFEFSLSFTW